MKINKLLTITILIFVFLTANASNLCVKMHYSTLSRDKYVINQIEKFNSFIQDKDVFNYKLNAMKESPFSFYRGTAHLYFKDLSNGIIPIPAELKNLSNINIWITGDLHTQNLGFFENNSKEIIFGLNDFDEAFIGPFYWELIRYVASLELLKNKVGFNLNDQKLNNLVQTFLTQYHNSLKKDKVQEINLNNASGFILNTMEDVLENKTQEKLMDKWTVISDNKRIFDFDKKKLKPVSETEKSIIKSGFDDYLDNISDFFFMVSDVHFTIKSIAKRLRSGLGSQGLKKYYVLIEGETLNDEDDIILEIKEQRYSSLLLNPEIQVEVYNQLFNYDAERVNIAHYLMLQKPEPHYGAFKAGKTSYSIKKISPFKYGFDGKDFNNYKDLENFVIYSAKVAAYGHMRSSVALNYDFRETALKEIENITKFNTIISEIGLNYGRQVKKDFEYFNK
ncbi:MAG: DUF2252 family protein [Candidatus Muiribacteriota bacterium]